MVSIGVTGVEGGEGIYLLLGGLVEFRWTRWFFGEDVSDNKV
jgi:hypothetical protein